AEDHSYNEPPLAMNGYIGHFDPKDDKTDDTYYQTGDLYRIMTEEQKQLLIGNTARNIMSVTENVKYRHLAHCYLADQDYGERLCKALCLVKDKMVELSKLSHKELMSATRQ
ncbi:MAG: catalase-related domain-containing protein, partial [Clostridia bacterium]